MSAAAPWSVKGIDPKAREIAKDLARRSGMTLGEWLNSMIMEDGDDDEGVTPLPRRSPIPDPYDRRNRSRRLDDVYGAGEDSLHRLGGSIETIAARLEAAERRSTVAIQGIDQAVAGLVRRLDGQDRTGATYGRRIEDIAEELREGHKRLRRFEQEVGPRTEETFGKVEASLGALQGRLYDIEERQRNSVNELRQKMEAIEQAAGPGAGSDAMAQVGARLDEAQVRTSEALKGLERSFAALDLRLRDAESRIEPEHAREAMRFEKLAETLTRQVEGSRLEMMRRLDTAETENRMDRIERAVAAVGDQVRASEQRSASAVEAMGREVLRIAQNLNGRMNSVEGGGDSAGRIEALGQALGEKLDRDMGRYVQAVDQRLTRSDDQHALALERLGGEITRISDRLSERIAQSERRSQQALDDIGRRLAENTEKIERRYDRASGELADRMRQSEERTARLLAEARDSIDQRGARPAARREIPLDSPEPRAWAPDEAAGGDWRAAAFADPGDAWSADVFDSEGPAPFPETVDQPFEASPPVNSIFSEPVAQPFGSLTDEPAPEPGEPEAPETASASPEAFGGADVGDVLAATEAGDIEFGGDTEFLGAATAERAASTRETLDAARAAMAPGDEGEARSSFGLLKRGGKTRLQERLDRQARRESSTVKKALGASAVAALLVSGGYASVQLAEDSGLKLRLPGLIGLVGGDEPPSAPVAPMAALALTPTEATPSRAVAETEGADLFARATAMLDQGDPAGMETLRRAANLGYAPAQLHLAGLYQEGDAGLEADASESRAWARRAAEGGDARAMHYYAMQLYDGFGGARNRGEALTWLTRAAEAGRVDSQYNVARLFERGDEGVAADQAQALKWYMIAARRGDQQALAAVERLNGSTSAEARRVARAAADAFTAEPLA